MARRERWLLVDGLPVFSRELMPDVETDAPPVVLVHGFAISGRYLLPTAEALAPHHPVYVPDLPGHGRSVSPARPFSIAEYADALAAYLDAAGVERAVVLGNSSGGLIAIDFANRYRARVERIVLVSPAGGEDNQPLVRALAQLALDALREPPALIPMALRDYLRFGPVASVRAFARMTRFPEMEPARALEVPVLLVAGRRDPLVKLERVSAALRWRGDATVVVVEDAAHAINFSHGHLLALLVRLYLAQGSIVERQAELLGMTLIGMSEAARARSGGG